MIDNHLGWLFQCFGVPFITLRRHDSEEVQRFFGVESLPILFRQLDVGVDELRPKL